MGEEASKGHSRVPDIDIIAEISTGRLPSVVGNQAEISLPVMTATRHGFVMPPVLQAVW